MANCKFESKAGKCTASAKAKNGYGDLGFGGVRCTVPINQKDCPFAALENGEIISMRDLVNRLLHRFSKSENTDGSISDPIEISPSRFTKNALDSYFWDAGDLIEDPEEDY